MRGRLLGWGIANHQDFPWRRRIPFWQSVVAEVLLQRTRADQAAAVFRTFRSKYRSAEAFGAAPEAELRELFRPLGLRWRTELLIRLAKEIGARRGRLPRDRPRLEELPGVGAYSAAAALSLHGYRREVIVDANVVRLVCRLTGQSHHGETRRQTWLRALTDRLTPPDSFRDFNYAMLDHGMLVCTVRNPGCSGCVLKTVCSYPPR